MVRFITCVLLFVSAAMAAASCHSQCEAQASSQKIEFVLHDNRIMLPVWVGESDTIQTILDTGMPIEGVYVFHREFAEFFEAAEAKEVRVPGAGTGEPSTALLFDSLTVSVAGIVFPEQKVLVSQSAITQSLPRGGVIGKTLFGSYAVEIDYELGLIHLHDVLSNTLDSTWTRVPLTIKKGIPFLDASLAVAGAPWVALKLYIDLASDEALELLVRSDMKFDLPETSEERLIGTGLSGDITGRLGWVDSLRIGPHVLRAIPAEFTPANVRSKQEGADGILANEVLRRFHVVFDMPNELLYLKPNRVYEEPFSSGR